MRITVLILGLLLGLLMFFQTTAVYLLGGLANNADATTAGAVGGLVALLWLVGCALVIPIPVVSAIVFTLAGLAALSVSADFPDMGVWGFASFVLAVLSVIGWVGKRRGVRKEEAKLRERDARLAASIRESISTSQLHQLPVNTVQCQACGSTGDLSSRFCAVCGAPRTALAPALSA